MRVRNVCDPPSPEVLLISSDSSSEDDDDSIEIISEDEDDNESDISSSESDDIMIRELFVVKGNTKKLVKRKDDKLIEGRQCIREVAREMYETDRCTKSQCIRDVAR